nr:Pantothenate permease [Candidatus Pantoea persica]
MDTEIILPLLAYLALIAALSVFAMRKQRQGNFLTEYFLGSRSMGDFVLAMTITTTSPISAPAPLSAAPVRPINI